MHEPIQRRMKLGIASFLGLALVAAPLVASPAQADTAGTGVVINELYSNGTAGGKFTNRYVELYNPTDAAVDLSAMSIQYRSATGTAAPSGITALTGSIPAKGYFLVRGGTTNASGTALPTPDVLGSTNFAGASGTVILAKKTSALTIEELPVGNTTSNAAVADLIGYGTSNTFETQVAPAGAAATSTSRTGFVDSDNNSVDFTVTEPTPTNSKGETLVVTPPEEPTDPEVPPTPGTVTAINAIQGTTDTSPLVGQTVTTRGVVTASYPTGGLDGFYIQTPGTGSDVSAAHTASDGLFVYSTANVASVVVGSYVEVTGPVSEYFGLTQITAAAGAVTTVGEAVAAPVPAAVALPKSASVRESFEGMLIAPQGDYTVTDNYDANVFGSLVLTDGTEPLDTPTAVAEPGAPAIEKAADNLARQIFLDDGASIRFDNAANKATPLPYISLTDPVRVGAAVTFTKPVILDYRFSAWSFQPTQQLTGANASTVQPAAFANTRTEAPVAVGGDVTVASFNVLNYFSTVGTALAGCSYYTDRAGAPVTVNTDCNARGAANQENLLRQQAKIVSAINKLDADVVSLMEIENSASVNGQPRDTALISLTTALNAAAGAGTWSYVASPTTVPANEDVIRTALIYKPSAVTPSGASVILDDAVFTGSARQPLAQAFTAKGKADSTFVVIANHFKSKGSGSGENADTGDGQGASNLARTNQAKALVAFAETMKTSAGTQRVLLAGDFNAYLKEDPIDVLAAAGYVDLGSRTGKESYSFDAAVGSLDHIFASSAAAANVSGVDIWNINSVESIALEYSRYNYNATNFYTADAYRSSDHDPVVVGLDFSGDLKSVNLLNINDFHGRIDANTVAFAGTIEKLKADAADGTLFLSDGDNVGASVYASSSQKDQPTIEVLNALGLKASAVGNHEFDAGYSDLTGRITDAADWDYLGANVYLTGTTTPALQEYEVYEVDGVRVAVIGAVTAETPTLVSPGGITAIEFGDPVEAVNRVAARIEAGKLADVIVAEYHEGAGSGAPDGATLEQELAIDSAFTDIVTKTSASVDAIFTGHTHKEYVWNAAVPGDPAKTRPVLQTGSYGENIGQISLTVDTDADTVVSYTARNVKRLVTTGATATTTDAALIAAYPAVAKVDAITKAALAQAAVTGNVKVGSASETISRAYTTAAVEDRGAESALGNLVADSLVASLSDPRYGGAEIGVVNPGGLRVDLAKGDITYSQANAVLPFANNLNTTTLTGAQFKVLLEQQWQTNADGTVPSRAFLNLGLSDNVNYTYDSTRAAGDRITSITVDGQPIDAAKGYRIGTFSFLLTGGDNFRIFKQGTDSRDSGLVDRDAWISYITANSPLSPSFDRRGVAVSGVPTGVLEVGATASVTLDKLNLTSLGSPVNTEVSVSFLGSAAAPTVSPVTAGSATAAFTVPADAPAASTLVIVAKESGTTVRVPVSVNSTVVVPPVDPTDPTEPTDPGTPTPPVTAPVAAGVAALIDAVKDLITLATDVLRPGQTLVINVGVQYAGTWVSAWIYSEPTSLGWQLVDANGNITVTVPAGLSAGEHRIAVQDANGNVIGWAAVSVLAIDPITGRVLASTGQDFGPMVTTGLLLLMLGGAVVFSRRRRESLV